MSYIHTVLLNQWLQFSFVSFVNINLCVSYFSVFVQFITLTYLERGRQAKRLLFAATPPLLHLLLHEGERVEGERVGVGRVRGEWFLGHKWS